MVNGNLLGHHESSRIRRFGSKVSGTTENERLAFSSISTVSTNNWLCCIKCFDDHTVDNARCAGFCFDADHIRFCCSSVAAEILDRESISPATHDRMQCHVRYFVHVDKYLISLLTFLPWHWTTIRIDGIIIMEGMSIDVSRKIRYEGKCDSRAQNPEKPPWHVLTLERSLL